MPYKIEKARGGYFVVDKGGHKFSKKPLTQKTARAQQIAIALTEGKSTGKNPSKYFL